MEIFSKENNFKQKTVRHHKIITRPLNVHLREKPLFFMIHKLVCNKNELGFTMKKRYQSIFTKITIGGLFLSNRDTFNTKMTTFIFTKNITNTFNITHRTPSPFLNAHIQGFVVHTICEKQVKNI